MTYDLAIIGAGIAGSALARQARDAGLSTLLISDPETPPASRAAICVLRRAWRSVEERPLFDRSLEWYRRHGWVVTERAEVLNQKGVASIRGDWTLVDPIAPLLQPDLMERVDLETVQNRARFVVQCTAFGGPYAPTPMPGATAVLPEWAMQGDPPLRVAVLGPYRCVQAARVNGVVKVGSSKAKTRAAAIERCMQLVHDAAAKHVIDPAAVEHVEFIAATRSVLPKASGRYWAATPDGAWMGGFARVGYSLAPAIAHDVLQHVIRSVS